MAFVDPWSGAAAGAGRRAGSRASRLALWQTDFVLGLLRARRPVDTWRVVTVSTFGDAHFDAPISEIGERGVFTGTIDAALLRGEIDIAVHSLKDLPVDRPPGVVLAAVVGRDEPFDVLVSRSGAALDRLPGGAAIGTSSTRRRAQVLAARPDLRVLPIRGNVETRVEKVMRGDYDATVLAAAGLCRLDLRSAIAQRLSKEEMLPAPGQGAIAVHCRSTDATCVALLAEIDDRPARCAVEAERGFLAALGGGCSAPVSAYAECVDREAQRFMLWGRVSSPDGRRTVDVTVEGFGGSAHGFEAAGIARARGAAEILAESG